MAIVPTSIKFPPEHKQWLRSRAGQEGHGNVSRVLKSLIEKEMQRTKRGKK